MKPRVSRLFGRTFVTLGATSLIFSGLTLFPGPAPAGAAQAAVDLGTASSYAVLAGSTVTNTGDSVVTGNLGVSPGTAIVGFPPGLVIGTIHSADDSAAAAQADTLTAYNDATGRTPFTAVATELGGRTLQPGVYRNATLGITGTLTLDGAHNPDAVFIFQSASTLITASGSEVRLINSAQACNVFWTVGSSATLGSTTDFVGNVLAHTSITADNNATVDGRLLAQTGAVTLDDNTVTRSTCAAAVTTTTAATTTTGGPTTTAATPTTTIAAGPTTTAAGPTTTIAGPTPTTAGPTTTVAAAPTTTTTAAPTTTTTAAPTTTTAAPTTTTAAPTTTTTAAPTPTTAVPAGGPSPTDPDAGPGTPGSDAGTGTPGTDAGTGITGTDAGTGIPGTEGTGTQGGAPLAAPGDSATGLNAGPGGAGGTPSATRSALPRLARGDSSTTGGELARTGSDAAPYTAMAGVMAILLGAAMVRRSRTAHRPAPARAARG